MAIVVSCKVCGKEFYPQRRPAWGGGATRVQTFCSTGCATTYQHSPAGIAERFWVKVDKSAGPNGCWLWTGHKDKDGYGVFTTGPRGANVNHRAHRMAYEMSNPPIGDLLACHRCDTPACVNPAHVFPGTPADNARDMVSKGRHATHGGAGLRGLSNGRGKFSEEEIRGIRQARANGETNEEIAKRYRMIPNHIGRIISRQRYGWVTDQPGSGGPPPDGSTATQIPPRVPFANVTSVNSRE